MECVQIPQNASQKEKEQAKKWIKQNTLHYLITIFHFTVCDLL